eukprot:752929-Ditylum_brightwellii.AAC.1
MASLSQTVQCLSVEILDKYVFKPTRDQRLEDVILALCDFNRSCRWREFWHKKEIEWLNSSDPNNVKFKPLPKELGLQTNLTLVNSKIKGPKWSAELEKFLHILEMELLEKARKTEDPSTTTDTELKSFFDDLKEAKEKIVVPTNKTNAHLLVNVSDYNRWVGKHLRDAAVKIKRTKIVNLHQEATKYAESLQGILSIGEYGYLMEGLGSKAIPEPQLLIKDHKDKVDNKFPTRL